ncbi:indole-3-acetic acid-induced protein ARG7-like protein [Carex littledalei]|uniref:Indole-3-acetic acid-induced protein ARG7-like protein n=1 Tax=Carex littledalei TaxID=544730 RepID=A0A833RGT0_9POAL|nr:indole-3-acetic acid-induced protein ARG7-like protein [Carex littledalei]
MVWMRKERDASMLYACLTNEDGFKNRVPKGYVPILVGGGNTAGEGEERFLVHIKLLKEPFIASLLEQATEQFGYQQGVLRVPCDAHCFQHTINSISRGK